KPFRTVGLLADLSMRVPSLRSVLLFQRSAGRPTVLGPALPILLALGLHAADPDALHQAVWRDDVAAAQSLIRSGADPKIPTRYGVTPLSLACTNGDTAMVDLLLNAGADPNAPNPGGETPLMTAARTGRVGPVKSLLTRGANPNAKEPKRG